MCEPITIAATMAVAGAGISAIGQLQQGKAAKASADYQAQVARNNATLTEFQAQDAARRGEIERDRLRLDAKKLIGTGRTAYAAGNVMLDNGGSPLSWEQDVAAGAAADVEMSRYNTEMEQYGFRSQKQNYLTEANLLKMQGKQAVTASRIGAVSSLLGSVGTTGMQYYGMKSSMGRVA